MILSRSWSFPGGWPGVGLLLLRCTIGLTAALQALAYLRVNDHQTLFGWISGILTICAGVSLSAGFLTVVASILICFSGLAAAYWGLLIPAPEFLGVLVPVVLLVFSAAAIAMVGPGALSVDARLFGLRKITIPRAPLPPG